MKNKLLTSLIEVMKYALIGIFIQALFAGVVIASHQNNNMQSRTISGKVTSIEDGMGIPGANILEKGTSNGTVTDINGEYTLEVSEGAVLIFSSVGFISEEIEVGSRSVINMSMSPDILQLQEVVVIGYGTKKQGELTGAVTKVGGDKIEARPANNTLSAIQGLLPGVNITRTSGKPGNEGYDFEIRGISSINGNEPLVLIDGIAGDLSSINPNDIKDITVLKDAAAAIYGARAADGVVLITTKTGKANTKPMIRYSGNFSIESPRYMKEMTNTFQMAEMFNEAAANAGQPEPFSAEDLQKMKDNHPEPSTPGKMWYLEGYPLFYTTTDWNDEVFGNAVKHQHNLNVSGGTENLQYLFSGGYLRANGALEVGKNYSDRYNLRSNLNYSISEKLQLQTNISYDYTNRIEPSDFDVILNSIPRVWTYLPVYNPAGSYYQYQFYGNPVSWLDEGGEREVENSMLRTNFKADYEIIKGLTITGQAGINYGREDRNGHYRTFAAYDWDNNFIQNRNDPNRASYDFIKTLYKTYIGYATYSTTFADAHKVTLMAGLSHEASNYEFTNVWGTRFLSNEIFTLNLSDKSNSAYFGNDMNYTDWALNSYFGRFSYTFKDKYLLDATLRQDASSKFAPEKRESSLYPAVSLAWNLSEESFISDLNFFDALKLRGSWGKSGNQDIQALSNYGYISLINIPSSKYPFGSSPTPNQVARQSQPIASPERTWETIETYNIGLNVGVLDARMNLGFDYYVKNNTDMLIPVTYPELLGAIPPTTNSGTLRSDGFEIMAGWNDRVGELEYQLSANVAYTDNEMTDLRGRNVKTAGLNYYLEDYPLFPYFGYEADGIIKSQEELDEYKNNYAGKGIVPNTVDIGDVKYKDIDGDGVIQPNADEALGTKGDLVYLGSPRERLTFGFNIAAQYKQFDISVFFQGTGNREVIREGDFARPYYHPWFQPYEYFYNKTWSPERSDAEYGRLTHDYTIKDYNYVPSSLQVNKVSYMRCKNLQIGYNIPSSLLKTVRVQRARIYFSAEDLFEFAKGTWDKTFDPEENRAYYDNSYGRPRLTTNEGTYPFFRSYSIGLDIEF